MTKDTLKTAKLVLPQFGLSDKGFKKLPGGEVNSSFKIGDKVLRIYQYGRKPAKAIEHEIALMGYLRAKGLPVPKLFKTRQGGELAEFKDEQGRKRFAILMEFVQGRHLKPNDFALLSDFARTQARMHLAAKNFKPAQGRKQEFQSLYDWMDLEFNLALKKCKSENVRKYLIFIYKSIHADVRKELKQILALPGGDVHLDYDSDNILIHDSRIRGIIDFEDVANLPFALDVANSLWWWLIHNSNPRNQDRILVDYIFSYQKVRKLSSQETALIPLFMRMRNLTIGALAIVKGGKSGVVRRTRVITQTDTLIRGCKL